MLVYKRVHSIQFLLLTVLCGVFAFKAPSQPVTPASERPRYDIATEHVEYLDNGIVRVGADMDLGGAITYIADAKNRDNVINNYDWGRQIQLSYYSGPVPYTPGGKQPLPAWRGLGWNPIQVGDCFRHRSKVLEFKNDGMTLYSKSIPMHWPLDNVPGECTFETWITLERNTVHMRARLSNNRLNDKTQYPGRGQELPAVYTNGPLYRLFTYSGDKPFTSDAMTTIPTERGAGFPWHSWQATERWAALVRDDGWGLGVYSPVVQSFSGGFSGRTGQGGSLDAPTGYITPNGLDILDYNIQYDFECVFILGTLAQIRQYVYEHAARPAPPQYVFSKDRQRWYYVNARDTGWPVRGELNIDLRANDPYLVGPAEFWQAAEAPTLYIRAAYDVKGPGKAQVFWKHHGSGYARPVTFDIIPDGKYHTYEIKLSDSPEYRGAITGLRFDPIPAGQPGDRVRVKSIGFKRVEE